MLKLEIVIFWIWNQARKKKVKITDQKKNTLQKKMPKLPFKKILMKNGKKLPRFMTFQMVALQVNE